MANEKSGRSVRFDTSSSIAETHIDDDDDNNDNNSVPQGEDMEYTAFGEEAGEQNGSDEENEIMLVGEVRDGMNSDQQHLGAKSKRGKKRRQGNFLKKLTNLGGRRTNVPNVEERLKMGPLEKFKMYGRVPFKPMIHMALIVVLFVQVFLYTHSRQRFLGQSAENLASNFLPVGYENLQDNQQGLYTYYFVDMEDIMKDIERTTIRYSRFAKESVDTFVYLPESSEKPNTPSPIVAEAHLWHTNLRSLLNSTDMGTRAFIKNPIEKISDTLNEEHPFGSGRLYHYLGDTTRRREFFDRLEKMELTFTFQSLDYSSSIFFLQIAECIQWKIIKEYPADVRGGRIPAILNYEFSPCENRDTSFQAFFLRFVKPITWISMLTVLLSSWSNILTFKSIFHRLRLFQQYRKEHRVSRFRLQKHMSLYQRASFVVKHIPLAKNVTIWDLPRFLSPWVVVTIAADTINTIAGCLVIFSNSFDLTINFFMGIGVLISYCNIIRYLQYYKKFYVLVLALRNGMPNVLRFLVSSFPVFLGYALCGTILFGHYCHYFEDIDDSMVSLFSLVNGDAIHEIFDMLYGNNIVLAYISRIYVYSFVLLFICAVLNIFVLIMEDAFFSLAGMQQENEDKHPNDISGMEDEEVEHRLDEKQRKEEEMRTILRSVGEDVEVSQEIAEESIDHNIARLAKMVEKVTDSYEQNDMDPEMSDALDQFESLSKQLLEYLHADTSYIDKLVLRSRRANTLHEDSDNGDV